MSYTILPGPAPDYAEVDRFSDAPHPREVLSLYGHEAQEGEVLEAYRAGRLHHAWLIGGPEGIGKATLAYRIARFILTYPDPSHPDVQAAQTLDVPLSSPAAHHIAANSHPDLSVIRRAYDVQRKAVPTEISADAARKGLDVFTKTAASGGYRICIVDACDDLNSHSANALLKTLEEPPRQGLFLLVAHQPRRLLPTIRSRCRSLPLRPLSESDVRRVTMALPSVSDADPELHARAAALADGSVRQALAMLDPKRLAFNDKVEGVLAALPEIRMDEVDSVAEQTAGRDGEAAFDRFCVLAQAWLHRQLVQREGDVRASQAIADLWTRLEEQRRDVETYNLDRRPFVIGMLSEFAGAVRHG